MNNWNIEVPEDMVPFERLSPKERSFLIDRLGEQFTIGAAIRLYDIGSVEEKETLVPVPVSEHGSANLKVELARSAMADWGCFSRTLQAGLDSAVQILQSQSGHGDSMVSLHRPEGFLLRHGGLRFVYRRYPSENRIVIHAIGCWPINPLAKVWRYFDQMKALYLLESGKLYLRRLDLLTDQFEGDPYEGTPTFAMLEAYKQAHRQHVNPANNAELMKRFERERRATFVSCWQRSESESWLMWKQYCRRGGGVAVQTTERRLNQLFQALRKNYDDLYLRSVHYINHCSDDPLPHEVPVQVFYKPAWFSDEREIRLFRFHGECAHAGSVERCEAALRQLDDHECLSIELTHLVEAIVLNPFSTDDDRKAIIDQVRSKRPELAPRLRDSDISKHPVVS